MSTSTTRPARPARQAGKATGAWADGDSTPLNHNEQFKQDDDGLNVRQRIIDDYSRHGFSSIAGDDLRGRMRWWGLYTQRKPGIDGGRTATLDPSELDDTYFMLRIRSDGGTLSGEQLRTIAGISTDFGRGTADITDRQNIQLHWIRIEDVPQIWDRLESVRLMTTEACGDCRHDSLSPRVMATRSSFFPPPRAPMIVTLSPVSCVTLNDASLRYGCRAPARFAPAVWPCRSAIGQSTSRAATPVRGSSTSAASPAAKISGELV